MVHAGEFARNGHFDGFVAVGGGSALDTCKVANLLAADPSGTLLDYVNAPIGLAKAVTVPLKPMIAGKNHMHYSTRIELNQVK